MKKITIGRGRECDIRLEDSTDTVSRRQAVITVTPFGKMEIYDTSSNGTFVNGQKVEKPNGMPLKRGDKVNFAHVADLDWSMVKDPYRKTKLLGLLFLIVAIATVVIILALANRTNEEEVKSDEQETEKVETPALAPEDSLKLQVPVETKTPQAAPAPSRKGDNKKVQEKPSKKNTGELINQIDGKAKPEKDETPEVAPHDPSLDDALRQR